MAQLTTKMVREINELAIMETELYAKNMADETIIKPQEILYHAVMSGGYRATNTIVRYLLEQLEEEQQ